VVDGSKNCEVLVLDIWRSGASPNRGCLNTRYRNWGKLGALPLTCHVNHDSEIDRGGVRIRRQTIHFNQSRLCLFISKAALLLISSKPALHHQESYPPQNIQSFHRRARPLSKLPYQNDSRRDQITTVPSLLHLQPLFPSLYSRTRLIVSSLLHIRLRISPNFFSTWDKSSGFSPT
jgi:hypothetical protein